MATTAVITKRAFQIQGQSVVQVSSDIPFIEIRTESGGVKATLLIDTFLTFGTVDDRFIVQLRLSAPRQWTNSQVVPEVRIENEFFEYRAILDWLLDPQTENVLYSLLYCHARWAAKNHGLQNREIARILFNIHDELRKHRIEQTLESQRQKRMNMLGIEPREPD